MKQKDNTNAAMYPQSDLPRQSVHVPKHYTIIPQMNSKTRARAYLRGHADITRRLLLHGTGILKAMLMLDAYTCARLYSSTINKAQ